MRALSLAAAGLVALTLHASAQQPARKAPPKARSPAPAARPVRPAAAPRVEAAVPFAVGETLTYDVAWSNYLVAGSAVTRVVEKRPSFNSTAYYIVAEGKPIPLIARFYSVYYKMDSLLDSFSALSQRTSLYTEEGAAKRSATTLFNRGTKRASVEWTTGAQTERDELVVPANVQDGLATLYTLRGRALRTGEKVSVPVTDNGTLYTVNFEVGAPEPITVPLGSVTAWNLRITILDGKNQAIGNNVRAWISTDARRLPVRLQADLPVGNFALALRSAQ